MSPVDPLRPKHEFVLDPEGNDPVLEIISDGRIVWVNTPEASIGRFGINGIDVHTESGDGCLHCTHQATTREDWTIFQEKMLEHHKVVVDDEHMPFRFQ